MGLRTIGMNEGARMSYPLDVVMDLPSLLQDKNAKSSSGASMFSPQRQPVMQRCKVGATCHLKHPNVTDMIEPYI